LGEYFDYGDGTSGSTIRNFMLSCTAIYRTPWNNCGSLVFWASVPDWMTWWNSSHLRVLGVLNVEILSRVGGWLCAWGFGLHDWIYWHLIHTTRSYRHYSATADLHTLQFTVTHSLGFSVFTSRILATDS
jgi:hypothetical protein